MRISDWSSDVCSSDLSTASAAADLVSTNISTVAAASEQMGSSIGEIASSATGATKVADNDMTVAHTTTETVSRLGKSSARTGEFIKVIASIAEHTKLPALTAPPQAGRAREDNGTVQ